MSRIWHASTKTPTIRRADLLQLKQIATGYPSRQKFLTDLTLDPPEATSDRAGPPHLDEDYLDPLHHPLGQGPGSGRTSSCSTPSTDASRSTSPSGERDDIEEERRLLYVAMTRAQGLLHLITPQRFYTSGQASRGDRHVYASRTRLIPDRALGHFARVGWSVPVNDASSATKPIVPVDLREPDARDVEVSFSTRLYANCRSLRPETSVCKKFCHKTVLDPDLENSERASVDHGGYDHFGTQLPACPSPNQDSAAGPPGSAAEIPAVNVKALSGWHPHPNACSSDRNHHGTTSWRRSGAAPLGGRRSAQRRYRCLKFVAGANVHCTSPPVALG